MKPSGIGGQAVIEGVMMRNKDHYAVSVRKANNEIVTEVFDCKENNKSKILKWPIIRGVVNFVSSMKIGMASLNFSASFFEEGEEEPGKTENFLNKVTKGHANEVLTVCTTVLAIILALGIFVALPFFISGLLSKVVTAHWVRALIEGVIRVAIFILYIVAISLLQDIKRVFMYHGAEHKCINCVENGLPLTVENAKAQSRQHRRCGTSFLLIVVVLSVLFFMFINVDNVWLKLLLRILLIPVIAGVSYEFLKFSGKTENAFVLFITKPGLWLQGLTTREPDDEMIEVAIASVEAVFDWKSFVEADDVSENKVVNKAANKATNKAANKSANKATNKASESTCEENEAESKTESDKAALRKVEKKNFDIDENDDILKNLDRLFDEKK
ncbi:MAG: DUF1385 domain-containing protein [Lachnospiraceae bacterium]|nr:DUF1385 domain-containing protein [Lachnospiraceae bacterium]